MGMNFIASSSTFDKYGNNDSESPQTGNPDPSNYNVVQSIEIGSFLIIEISYPDCENYEGRKIMVYESVTIEDLLEQKYIDPHFAESDKFHSPVARFEPTPKGWDMATTFVEAYREKTYYNDGSKVNHLPYD